MKDATRDGVRTSESEGMLSGGPWRELLSKLEEMPDRMFEVGLPCTPQMGALAYRHLLRLVRAGEQLLLEFVDAERPVLQRQFDLGMAFALDNPDTVYHHFPVNPEATYCIRGEPPGKGKPPHFISVSGMVFETAGLPRMGADLNNANGSLKWDSESGLEVHISAERSRRNWLELEPQWPRQRVFIRQTFQDWEDEWPLRLELERVGQAKPCHILSAEVVADSLAMIAAFVEFQAQRWVRNTLEAKESGENVLPVPKERPDIAGLSGQLYAQGFYKVAPGQALLVAFRPPGKCGYWGIQLANWLGESLDYANRRVSISGHQAVLDRDGVFRAVLAAEDPGVSNWLDIGGGEAFSEGLIILRVAECDESGKIDAPETRLLPLDRLWEALPREHERVASQERERDMRARRRHLARRLGQ